MNATCFFCETLLSDLREGHVSEARRIELEDHLKHCQRCTETNRELESTLNLLHRLCRPELTHELATQIVEVSEGARTHWLSGNGISRSVLFATISVLFLGGIVFSFPQLFPWTQVFRGPAQSTEFTRYYPLFQGASEIVEEQSQWLQMRDSLAGSFWEEGGMSPEEFERTFQLSTRHEPDR